MRSIVDEADAASSTRRTSAVEPGERIVPDALREMRRMIRKDLETRLSGAEWRAMGVENAGGPVIQVSAHFSSRHETVDRELTLRRDGLR
jgi:hypothetical protein